MSSADALAGGDENIEQNSKAEQTQVNPALSDIILYYFPTSYSSQKVRTNPRTTTNY